MGGDDTFDWKGEAGDKYADWNPSDVEGTDKTWVEFHDISCTDVLKQVLEALTKEGLKGEDVKVSWDSRS